MRVPSKVLDVKSKKPSKSLVLNRYNCENHDYNYSRKMKRSKYELAREEENFESISRGGDDGKDSR